jgi:ABC-2 type transport system permease protein
MPIFDQGYQHWQGSLSGLATRWWIITIHGVRMQWKNKWTRRIVVMSIFPALMLATALTLWGLFEQKVSFLMPLIRLMQGLPKEIVTEPRAYRPSIWTFCYYYFFQIEIMFALLLVLVVGPGLISQDLRFNAIPLYFSRPLRRLDYFAGKLGVIGFYVSAVMIFPALLAYALGVAFSLDLGVIKDTARVLAGSLAFGGVVVLSAGSLMLAFSSLSKNSRFVAGLMVVAWVVSEAVAGVMIQTVNRPWCRATSYGGDLARMLDALLDVESAWEPFGKLADFAVPDSPFSTMGGAIRNPFASTFPWTYAAYALAGVFVLSLWTLSMRVKSLDRLR